MKLTFARLTAKLNAGTMVKNIFLQNSGANGGAVWQNNLKLANHTSNLFVANNAQKGSAGVEMNQVTTMSFDNCNFTLGSGNKGGAIYTQVMPFVLARVCCKFQRSS